MNEDLLQVVIEKITHKKAVFNLLKQGTKLILNTPVHSTQTIQKTTWY